MVQARKRLNPIPSNCAYCLKDFLNEGYALRKCCDRSCGIKYSLQSRGDRLPWTDKEYELLESIAGIAPLPELTIKYNRLAKKLEFPQRNENAIKVKLMRRDLSQQATEDNWKMSTLAELLGVHRDRVRQWTRGRYNLEKSCRVGGALPCRKISNITAISKKDFIEFARSHPEKLKGIHPRNLMFILQDQDLVHQITALGKPTTGHCHKIMRVDTGEVFRSAREAGEKLHMHPKHLLRQARKGKRVCGVEFRILEVVGSEDYSHLANQFPSRDLLHQRIEEMKSEGMKTGAIAQKLGIKTKAVQDYLRRHTPQNSHC